MKAKASPPILPTNGVVVHATHNEVLADANPEGSAVKLSVNVANAIGTRLRRLAFDERVSESSIVEIALDDLFRDRDDAVLGQVLRDRGASLRRAVRT